MGKMKKKQDEKSGEDNPYISEAEDVCTVPTNVWIKYRNGYSLGRANVTFASNDEADLVVDKLNEMVLQGRKVAINWALPIKDYQFIEQRNKALGKKEEMTKRMDVGSFLQDNDDEKEEKKMEVDEDEDVDLNNSVLLKKIKRLKAKKKKKIKKESVDDVVEKVGAKRKQSFSKPHTKKIKMAL